ncbi:MAG TPA: 50S ribosomal protein L13 [Candidatus Deferrimicrobium sp.]|nr:50S ribosomal protein L13 [Candidatus Deferrimicrobium sp.]
MSTYMATPQNIERKWYILDATDKPLGRLATEAARLLRGKHKPVYTPNVDSGDHVIILNADKIILTGNKLEQKYHYSHSGYPGGLKATSYKNLLENNPERAIEYAVRGMIPHNKLGRQAFKKLKVYQGSEHPHQAQKPEVWQG